MSARAILLHVESMRTFAQTEIFMTLIELTPPEMACVVGPCPAVFESEDGKEIVLIGRRLRVGSLAHRVADDEELVSISKEMVVKALSRRPASASFEL